MRNLILVFLACVHLPHATLWANDKRDLLGKAGTIEFLEENLIMGHEWVSFPAYSDRLAWEKIPEQMRDSYILEGEKYLDFDWPTIPATAYLDFVRTGDRETMQRPNNQRRTAFQALVMAELMEGKGRFLDQIINGVWVFCEQTYWGLSAHLNAQKAGPGLPDITEPTIDLGVGMVATDLAWTWYFFREEFDKVNPLISIRLKSEITHKVLEPYYSREDFWWQGFDNEFVNNWNPWCNYNVLNCVMLLEDDRDVKIKAVNKVLKSVDQFINYYHDDGGCDEGPSYWSHAGGKLFEVLELVHWITDGKLDIYSEEVIKNTGRYIYRAYVSDPYYINFADASAVIHTRPGVIYRYGKRIDDPDMSGFGAFLANEYDWGQERFTGKIELALTNLFGLEEILNAEAKEPLIGEFWLPETEISGARDRAESREGFYFAAKGGHNRESHNHNDAGSFILYYDGKPCLVDAGVGTYTAKTFSPQRYEIWTMQSQYHNLPRINGVDQKDGIEYKALNSRFNSTRSYVEFSADIAGAYPEAAKVRSWIRSYRLNRGKNFIITDEYDLITNQGNSSLNFLTSCEITVVKPGEIRLVGSDFTLIMKFEASSHDLVVEDIELEDSRLQGAWPGGLKRLVFKMKSTELKGRSRIVIEKT